MLDTRSNLVGRGRQLREVRLLIDAVRASRGSAMVLSGEAGAGKTRLAEEASHLATEAGVQVGWATCWRTAGAPLSVWDELVGSIGDSEHLRVEQPASTDDPEATRALWVHDLARELLAIVDHRPTLLVVDDAQWSDPLSLHALGALRALSRSSPVGVLCTYRDDLGDAEGLAQLARAARHLVVSPLDAEQLGELALDVTGRSLTRSQLGRLHERTAGNVLFARQLLLEGDVAATFDADRQPVASDAAAVFAERLAAVPADCREALLAASVIGRRFRPDVLAEMLGVQVEAVLDRLGDAEAAQLVRPSRVGSFEFVHPLAAEACYAAAGLPRRIRLHRDAGEAMERLRAHGLPVAAAEIAHHFANASAGGVAAKAVDYAAIAGREDMDQLAYEDAVRDFRLALHAHELCPADDARQAELLLALGDAQAAAGDRVAARDAYESAAALARRHDWPDVLATAALGVGSGPGGFEVPPFDDRQIALLEDAAATTAAEGLRPRVLARLSVALALDRAAVSRRGELSREAITLARDLSDDVALGYALASWCDVIPGPDAVDDRLSAADAITRCAVSAGDIGLELLGRRFRIVALLEAGRVDDVDTEVAAYAVRADRLSQPAYSWYVPLWRSMRAAMEGRFDVADRLRATAATIGAEAHSDNAMMLTASQQAMLLCELRQPTGAISFFEELLEQFPDYAIMARPALAYALAAGGELARAEGIVRGLDISRYTIDALGSEFLTTVMMVAHASWLADYAGHAPALYEALVPFRSRFAIDGIGGYFVGSVERTLGVLASQMGDTGLAREHLDAALEQHRRVSSPVLVAGTLRDAGDALADDALRAEADRHLAALGVPSDAPLAAPAADRLTVGVFRRDGDGWLVGLDGDLVHVRHTKGMGDLARLLAQPAVEIHVLDLVDPGATLDTPSTGEAIDTTARRQYRARLEDIEVELADADRDGDVERSERLHLERDALIGELTSAYGLGGRSRRRGDSAERARSAVTQRIRDAITRIEQVHPEAGRHLRRAVRTGTFCAYEPDRPTTWER